MQETWVNMGDTEGVRGTQECGGAEKLRRRCAQKRLITPLLRNDNLLLWKFLALCKFPTFLQGLRVFLGGPPCRTGGQVRQERDLSRDQAL